MNLRGFTLPDPGPPPRQFPVRPAELVQLVQDYRPGSFDQPMAAEEKHDGIRALWVAGHVLSRNGAPIECAGHLADSLARLETRLGGAHVVDGEYVEEGGFAATLDAFNSRGRRGGRGTMYVFDAIPLADWRAGRCDQPLTARRTALHLAMAGLGVDGLELVPQRLVSSEAEAMAEAERIWARGGEGIVLKRPSSVYVCARSPDWRRIKRRIVVEARIVDVVESEKRPGEAGAVICDIGGMRQRVPVKGAQRLVLWARRLYLAGEPVTIEAMERTARGGLRQPRLIGME